MNILFKLGSGSFTTNFPATEAPITGFKLGLADGLDWANVDSNGTSAYGSAFATGYDDCIACKTGFTANKHSSQITVKKTAGYTAPTDNNVSHEVECLTGWNISAHSASGYEFDIDFLGGGVFVRWNGPINNFTVQGQADDNLLTGKGWTDAQTGTMAGIVHGDIVRVDYDSTSGSPVLKAYLNGVLKITVSDTNANKITSGNPGVGFFVRPGTGMDLTKYCISSWTGASL